MTNHKGSILQRPAERLPLKPLIDTREQLDRALHEYAWLKYREDLITAKHRHLIEQVTDLFQRELFLEVDGESVAFADRRAVLEAVIEQFANEHRDALCAGDAKSVTLTHCELAWKRSRDSIGFVKGYDATRVVKAIDKLGDVISRIASFCQRLWLFDNSVHPHELVDVKLSLSKTKAKAMYDGDRITRKQLQQIGLVFVTGVEQFHIKPHEHPLRSESSEMADAA